MAAEKKTATPTEYLVLKQITRQASPGGGGTVGSPSLSAASTMPANSWGLVQAVTATSATAAIRACVSKLAEKDQAGTFVAVPARSWKPVSVNPQTTIRLELTEAKP